MIKELSKYGIVKNETLGLILMFETETCKVDNPIFYYKGGDNATLVKNKTNIIQFNNIKDDVKKDLMEQDKILVAEVNDGSVLNEYTAIVKHEG